MNNYSNIEFRLTALDRLTTMIQRLAQTDSPVRGYDEAIKAVKTELNEIIKIQDRDYRASE